LIEPGTDLDRNPESAGIGGVSPAAHELPTDARRWWGHASAVAGVASLPRPRPISGGIGQLRTYMYLLPKAHIREVSVTAWPDELQRICEERNIHVSR
jgi:hypothetical protein